MGAARSQRLGETRKRVGALLRQGIAPTSIAQQLEISRQAVYFHRKKIHLGRARPPEEQPPRPRPAAGWRIYNEALVQRGEFLLDLSPLQQGEPHSRVGDCSKRGRPYQYPVALIQFAMQLKVAFHVDYRTTEGVLRAVLGRLGLKVPDFSTLCRRMKSLPDQAPVFRPTERQELAVDSSGRTQSVRGSYRESRYQLPDRQFIKVHVALNVATKEVQSVEITPGREADVRIAPRLIQGAKRKGSVAAVYADRGYDGAPLRAHLLGQQIRPVIRPRQQMSRGRLRLSRDRARARLQRETQPDRRILLRATLERIEATIDCARDYEGWRARSGYGKRAHVEGHFSRDVRIFGDCIRSKTPDRSRRELILRTGLLNRYATQMYDWAATRLGDEGATKNAAPGARHDGSGTPVESSHWLSAPAVAAVGVPMN